MNTAIFDGPIAGPDWFVAKVTAAAALANRLPGTSTLTIGNGPGSLGNETPEEAARREAAEAWDAFDSALDTVEELQKQEREAWEQSTHRFAGLDLTGAEYGELGDALSKDSPLRNWLIERMKRDGKSEEEAKHDTDLIALAMKGMALPESQRTQEQRDAIRQVNDSPELSRYARDAGEIAGTTYGHSRTSERDTAHLTNTDQVTSVTAGADVLYADTVVAASPSHAIAQSQVEGSATNRNAAYEIFPTAPPAGEHHRAALAATQPLDAAPVQVAAVTPLAPASAGLDL